MKKNLTLAQIEKKSITLRERVTTTITCAEQAKETGLLVHDIMSFTKQVEGMLDPQCKAAYASWQIALKQKKKYVDPLKALIASAKKAITEWDLKEKERIERETAEAEEAAKREEERERKALENKLTKTKDPIKREAIEEQLNSLVSCPVCFEKAARIDGIVKQSDWEITVVDMAELMKAVVEEKINISVDAFDVSIQAIKLFIKATGIKNIPGCSIKDTFIQRVVKTNEDDF